METFYAKGMSLRTKVLVALGAIYLMFIALQAVNLYDETKLVRLLEAERGAVAELIGDRDVDQIATLAQKYGALLKTAQDQLRRDQVMFGVLILVALLVTLGLHYYVERTVLKPLNRLVDGMHEIARGNLTVSLAVDKGRRDEIAEASGMLNILADRLNGSVGRVAQAAEAITLGSQELSSATEQLSSSAQEQASSLEETAASMEEMTSTVKHNADNAVQVDRLAAESAEAANESVTMATSLQRSMDLINNSSNKIADIIGVIDEIAFQTNLLALNAAVEAARAGEHGRGFAVVASEVRNLAQRSAQAAKEIKALINDSVEKAGDGAHLVSITAAKLEGIVGKVKHVAELISEINASSQEQASGIEQVNRAIVQMDSVTQSNAAQVEELSGTSQSLAVQAGYLRELVSHFQLKGASPAAVSEVVPESALAKAHVGAKADGAPVAANVEMLRPRRAAGGRGNDDWTEF